MHRTFYKRSACPPGGEVLEGGLCLSESDALLAFEEIMEIGGGMEVGIASRETKPEKRKTAGEARHSSRA